MINNKKEISDPALLLFNKIQECMQLHKLFFHPDLNRKKLADFLNTNEVYIADAIRDGAGCTFSEYISALRLKNAICLINDYPEMSIADIIIDSGYGSYSQFFRSFTKKYAICPSEYRRLLNKKINNL